MKYGNFILNALLSYFLLFVEHKHDNIILSNVQLHRFIAMIFLIKFMNTKKSMMLITNVYYNRKKVFIFSCSVPKINS